ISGSEPFAYPTPSVEVTGLAIDSQDRPVLTGVFVEHVTLCYPGTAVGWHGSYVARLTVPGNLDPSFHGSGVLEIADMADASRPTLASTNRILYVGAGETQCLRGAPGGPTTLTALGEDGQLDLGFGTNGYVALGPIEPRAMGVDRRGRIFIAGPILESSEYEEEPELKMVMISPAGVLNAEFGYRGFAHIPSWMSTSAIAIDRLGRILLAGSDLIEPLKRSRFQLVRMKPSGKIDRRFGHGGSVRTGFGGRTLAEPTEILVDPHGRILVGGVISSPRLGAGNGVGLARYLGG
ncbi:MAG TPA: hypothetical protein VN756_10860, partial [Solirubrobacterales bacterium]|nr:hypothetical protein [Solirubrobacterales bacterium]